MSNTFATATIDRQADRIADLERALEAALLTAARAKLNTSALERELAEARENCRKADAEINRLYRDRVMPAEARLAAIRAALTAPADHNWCPGCLRGGIFQCACAPAEPEPKP